MKVSEKVQRAKALVDFIASHDDADVTAVEAALREVSAYARAKVGHTTERRLGSVSKRAVRYVSRLASAAVGR